MSLWVGNFQQWDVVRLLSGGLAVVECVVGDSVHVSVSSTTQTQTCCAGDLRVVELSTQERELIGLLRQVAARGDVRIEEEPLLFERRMIALFALGLVERRGGAE